MTMQNMNFFKLLSVALLFALQYALWFGDKNYFDLQRLQNATAHIFAENAVLQQRNEKLLAEVIDLKKGGETIETLARSQFGLVKKGETFFQIVE
ncbi:MAG: Cell division protein FtsB [Arenicellales bacterium IbO2]|nr:septum formation initiator family protein [Gammaproteobacteria bacterium]MDA7962307.1 septum formation initiator family protein [Gammaproteobacteria bacterium]MDA7995601.1 septum formation initiator family protein [Gammaproteobacteria bacterium]CAJ2376217.1 MAG: Cell division protein FtsB [Arenicellales bacterium IbO2]